MPYSADDVKTLYMLLGRRISVCVTKRDSPKIVNVVKKYDIGVVYGTRTRFQSRCDLRMRLADYRPCSKYHPPDPDNTGTL